MNEMKNNQNHLEGSKEKDWVFLAIKKVLIAKRTDQFVLVKLSYGQSAIINAKFLRKKESEEYIYASLPYDYKISIRQTEFALEDSKWHVVSEKTIFPRQLHWELYFIDKCVKEGKDLKELLEYSNLEVDTDEMPKD